MWGWWDAWEKDFHEALDCFRDNLMGSSHHHRGRKSPSSWAQITIVMGANHHRLWRKNLPASAFAVVADGIFYDVDISRRMHVA